MAPRPAAGRPHWPPLPHKAQLKLSLLSVANAAEATAADGASRSSGLCALVPLNCGPWAAAAAPSFVASLQPQPAIRLKRPPLHQRPKGAAIEKRFSAAAVGRSSGGQQVKWPSVLLSPLPLSSEI